MGLEGHPLSPMEGAYPPPPPGKSSFGQDAHGDTTIGGLSGHPQGQGG